MVHERKPRLLCVLSLHSASWCCERERDQLQTLDRVFLAAFQVGNAFKLLGVYILWTFLVFFPQVSDILVEPRKPHQFYIMILDQGNRGFEPQAQNAVVHWEVGCGENIILCLWKLGKGF